MKRQSILIRNRELLEHEADQASSRGESDFAFLCIELDGSDTSPPDVREFVQKTRSGNGIPTRQVMMPRTKLHNLLADHQKMLHKQGKGDPLRSRIVEDIARPARDNHCWVIVLAAQGKLACELPIPSQQSMDSSSIQKKPVISEESVKSYLSDLNNWTIHNSSRGTCYLSHTLLHRTVEDRSMGDARSARSTLASLAADVWETFLVFMVGDDQIVIREFFVKTLTFPVYFVSDGEKYFVTDVDCIYNADKIAVLRVRKSPCRSD